MKVRFLKDHLEWTEGEELEVDEDRGNYWINTGVAEEAKEKKQIVTEKEKNSKTGPTSKKKK